MISAMAAVARALKSTFPVFWGYLAAGVAFGLLLRGMGYGPIYSFGFSTLVYAGSAQMLLLKFLSEGEVVASVFFAILLLNIRHFAYGLAIFHRYKTIPWRWRWYLIFGLTDETFALLSAQKDELKMPDDQKYLFWVTLINQIYWVFASILGTVAGSYFNFDLRALFFVLPALFVVLLVEYILKTKDTKLPLIGAGAGLIALVIAPAYMLPVGLLFIFIAICFDRRGAL